MRHHLAFILFAAGMAVVRPMARGQEVAPAAGALLTRAAEYVHRFEQATATVVLEEQYVQVIKHWTGPPKQRDPGLAWISDWTTLRKDVTVLERRQTKSDVLLVQLPDQRWVAFRDTFEVNGRVQPNREDRLRGLFLNQTEESRRQLRKINEASARWNLGGFYRELNLPTMGLVVLHPEQQRRFAFREGALETFGATSCRVVAFKETARPTLVRSVRHYDVPLTGTVCLDETGTVWKTHIDLDPRYTMRGAIEVTYARDDRVNVLVPDSMWEWYVLAEPDRREGSILFLEASAVYSNIRRFTVTTSEQVK